jgi:hypothetical protein
LQFLARAIIKLIREETMRATHVAHRRNQNVEQDRRERLAGGEFRVTLQ